MDTINSVPAPSTAAPRPRNWFDKNWKWFVPLLAGVGLLVLGSFVLGVFSLVNSMFRDSYPYKVAMDRANASAEVSDRIGKPFKVGWFTSGSINYRGPEGDAALNIPITGPKGRGTIVVVAKRHVNRWTFETLEVDVEGQDNPIPLLDHASPAASPPSSDTT